MKKLLTSLMALAFAASIYAAEYPTMNALLFFLTENCCGRPSTQPLTICQPDIAATTAPRAKRSA